MINLTKFDLLRLAVRKLGAKDGAELLPESIKLGFADLDPEDVVFGDSGLFYVDPNGLVARVVVHIADIDSRYISSIAMNQLVLGQALSHNSIDQLHRYHIFNCGTLEEAKRGGWRDRYKLARKEDGLFFYRLLGNNRVIKTIENQKLYICKRCHSFASSAELIELKKYWPEFELERFLNGSIPHQNIEGDFLPASESTPSIYSSDWRRISKKFKEKVSWRCQSIHCAQPDLSMPSLQKFLEVHHRNLDKSNNNYLNLIAYCIACHSQQPNHGHIRSTPRFKEYMALRTQLESF